MRDSSLSFASLAWFVVRKGRCEKGRLADVQWLGRRAMRKVGAGALLSPWWMSSVMMGWLGWECWMYCM
jgi:hypothetical protein